MSKRNDGGWAFPRIPTDSNYGHAGMSLRDYCLIEVLAGIYAAQIHGLNADHAQALVKIAADAADAMIAERSKE